MKVKTTASGLTEMIGKILEDLDSVMTPYLGQDERAEEMIDDLHTLTFNLFGLVPKSQRKKMVGVSVSEETSIIEEP